MRTYARKRTEYQLIEGVHEMCRLCLEKVKETVPIFTDTENVCPSLTMRIMMCVGLEVTREDCLPDMICTECHKELNNYYEFKKRCILTYQKLKSHVLAVKQTGTKNVTDLKVKQNENETLSNVLDRVSNDNVEPVLAVNQTQELEVNIDPNDLSNVPTENIEKPSTDPTANIVVTPDNQDVSEFISSILSELGILTRNADQALMVDQNVKLIEIETGDDTKVILELVEVDEGQQNAIKNNISNNEISIQSTIKYIEPCDIEQNVIQPKDERARCPQCGKRFASRGALRRHARVHSGERPYACAVCGRAFAQREVLRRHELVHGEKPFKCAQCGKGFTQRSALAAHTRSHAAPDTRALALHRCARCPKVFLHASGLSRHAMQHNGRVFACGACERRFSDKSSLLRHLRAKHAQPPAADEPA